MQGLSRTQHRRVMMLRAEHAGPVEDATSEGHDVESRACRACRGRNIGGSWCWEPSMQGLSRTQHRRVMMLRAEHAGPVEDATSEGHDVESRACRACRGRNIGGSWCWEQSMQGMSRTQHRRVMMLRAEHAGHVEDATSEGHDVESRACRACRGRNIGGSWCCSFPSFCCLGVYIDEDLTWQNHIQYIINKLVKFCSIFYKLRSIVPPSILRKLYFALVHPHLIYGIEIYANTYQKYLDPLIKLNNKILRILQNRKLNYPVLNLYRTYNTLPLHQLHNFFILMLLHKFKFNRNELPEPFWVYFTENYTIHSHNTRQIKSFHLDRKNTTLGQRYIQFKGGKLWNDIPSTIKLLRNKYTFKRKLKLYLMNI